jgi:hypothetical protein
VGISTSQNPNTPEGLESWLSVEILRIPAELLHSTDYSMENSVEPKRILVELLRSSYEECSRPAGRPSGPQSLTTLPTRLRLAATLRMRALQVESLKCGVCLLISTVGGIYMAMGELDRLGEVSLVSDLH